MSMPDIRLRSSRKSHQSGVGLIELMVALVIGLFLIFGAVTIYQQSRTAFRTTEAVARLQEAGRLAMDVIESDVRMANYWGLNNRAAYIVNRAKPDTGLPEPFDESIHKASIDTCGSNWAINLEEYIAGSNNSYDLGCAAYEDAAQAGSDTLTIRRGGEAAPTTLSKERIYIQSSRVQGTMFVPASNCSPTDPACIPGSYSPPASQSRELVAHAYYVASVSTMRDDVPSLRRKSFASVISSANAIEDEEIVPGVEDLQVRFGIDTDGDTNIDEYRNPEDVPTSAAVVSATIWLRIRADEPEVGFVDGRSYQYADMTNPFEPKDGYRRILMSKTIQLRNTRI